ncbi:cellulose biosynthesis protein BcsP [Undibacterium sp. RuTC16W]|uniref:cellulose biosynthesis protein BcsP n=1 Tax=Undibacterium sp. RuTC16W TaxID=3413048 RepID=UPI003BF2043D
MDNDIKNLFKKIDGSADSYKEIHRDDMNEQAKQRWPLLRDVHVNAAKPAAARAVPKVETISRLDDLSSVALRRMVPDQQIHRELVQSGSSLLRRAEYLSGASAPSVRADQVPKESSLFARAANEPLASLTGERGDPPLATLFSRLSGARGEAEQPPEPAVNSFFKKIFKP